ncbi:MAG: alpha/beta hydrolase [Saccharospirillum sp.]
MAALFIAALVLLVLLFGPRPRVSLAWAHARLPDGLDQLPPWLKQSEQGFAGLTDGAEKHIEFANPEQPAGTPLVVLYLHGFSATRQEISPVPERVAQALGANYYGARLTGHGLDGNALGDARADDWVRDAIEAWHVAALLGENVIIISCSTGGTLATWLAQQPSVQPQLAALVLFAPNFQPRQWATHLFAWPWARYWVPWVIKREHSWEPVGELNGKYWTYRYPTRVIHELQALVQAVRTSPVEEITAPSLFIYSDDDQVVSARRTDALFARWGAPHKRRIKVPGVSGQTNHVITGDIVAPQSTATSVDQVLSFLTELGFKRQAPVAQSEKSEAAQNLSPTVK